MVNMTLAIPEELHSVVRKHKEIKWSEVARKAMWEQAKRLELIEELVSKSRLSEKDVESIGTKIKEGIAKRHGLLK